MSKDDKEKKIWGEATRFKEGNTAALYWTEEKAQELLQEMGEFMIQGLNFETGEHDFKKNTTVESFYAMKAFGFVSSGIKNWWIDPKGEKVRAPVTKHRVQKLRVEYPEFKEALRSIRAIEKFKLTQGTLNGELKEAAAIFYLKCHHDMREAEKHEGEFEGDPTPNQHTRVVEDNA